jgi:hypothetical protein
VWWSFPVSGAALAGCAYLYYKFGGWRSARMGADAPAVIA